LSLLHAFCKNSPEIGTKRLYIFCTVLACLSRVDAFNACLVHIESYVGMASLSTKSNTTEQTNRIKANGAKQSIRD
jgi:hypothetical protein